MEKPRCRICGKEYKENNPALFKMLSAEMQEKLKYIPDCDCFEKERTAESEEMERKRQKECLQGKIKAYRDISIIDEKFVNSTFSVADMSSDAMRISKRYTELFIKNGTAPVGLLFHGTVGTGKTFASACISNALIDAGKTVMVLSIGLYLNKIQREWAEAENKVLAHIKSCDLLVIDDLGVEKVSDFVKDKVFLLIDTRYRTGKPIIVTTNLELKNDGLTESEIKEGLSIESRFGSRISDRLADMCQLCAVNGKSWRGQDTRQKFIKFMRGE